MTDLVYCKCVNYGSLLKDLQIDTTYRLDFVRRGECHATETSIFEVPGVAVNNIHIRNDSANGWIRYSVNAENIRTGLGGFIKGGAEREVVHDISNIKSVNIRPLNAISDVSIEVFI